MSSSKAHSDLPHNRQTIPPALVETGIAEYIAQDLPLLVTQVGDLRRRLPNYAYYATRGVKSEDPVERACALIRNQSTNDLLSLLNQCLSGDGRAAIRSARSLFEHEVNYRTVHHDADEALRYCEQMDAMAPLYLKMARGHAEKILQGRELVQARHQFNKLEREAASKRKAISTQRTNALDRQWSNRSLRERADSFRRTREYDYYRVFSAILHGSAIGIVGSHRVYPSDNVVFRTGIAPQLAPLAWEFGLACYLRHLKVAKGDVGEQATRHFLRAVELLHRQTTEFSRVVDSIDDSLWPDRPYDMLTLLHIKQSGTTDWYLYSGSEMMIAPSLPPPPEVSSYMGEFIKDRMPVILQELVPVVAGNDVSEIWVFKESTQPAPTATWRPLSTIIPSGQKQVGFPQLGTILSTLVASDDWLERAIESVRETLDDFDLE